MAAHRTASLRGAAAAVVVAVVVAAGGACSGAADEGPSPPSLPATTVAVAATTTTASPAATVPAVAEPTFSASVAPVTAADLGSSWRPGCPVGPEDLRLLTVSYWGFDDQPHSGAIVVAAGVADPVVEVFRTLFDQRFPIRRMEPVQAYGSDDDASMAADNTSGFNCRPAVTDGPAHWSNHAYGLAIDVNPVENPYLLSGRVLPPAGADYVDRSRLRPGMAVAGGVLTEAFAAVGWGWGGVWANPDYQHFSANGS